MLVEVTSLGAVNQTSEAFISGIVESISKGKICGVLHLLMVQT